MSQITSAKYALQTKSDFAFTSLQSKNNKLKAFKHSLAPKVNDVLLHQEPIFLYFQRATLLIILLIYNCLLEYEMIQVSLRIFFKNRNWKPKPPVSC